MANRTLYAGTPAFIEVIDAKCAEMMFFQYLPIKVRGGTGFKREARLWPFDDLIGRACCDFIGAYGLDRFVDSYAYLTAKHLYQGPSCAFNRPGWHIDGFLTDDVQYIWSSTSGTIFNHTHFQLSQDDALSMIEMSEQADESLNYSFADRSLIRIDSTVVHRVRLPREAELRTFFKLSFSRDKYDLEGNSINPLLPTGWPMRPRALARNVPQHIDSTAPPPGDGSRG